MIRRWLFAVSINKTNLVIDHCVTLSHSIQLGLSNCTALGPILCFSHPAFARNLELNMLRVSKRLIREFKQTLVKTVSKLIIVIVYLLLSLILALSRFTGAMLASPIDVDLLKHMKAIIGVNNHTTPYFIGIKARNDGEFVSEEGNYFIWNISRLSSVHLAALNWINIMLNEKPFFFIDLIWMNDGHIEGGSGESLQGCRDNFWPIILKLSPSGSITRIFLVLGIINYNKTTDK